MEQACESVKTITEGQGIDDPKPYADALLTDPCLNGNGLPVITDLVTLAISHGHYDSRMRMLIKHVAWQLRVSWDHLEEIEAILAETLEAKQYEMSEEEQKEKKKKSRNQKIKRIALISLATVGGGALIGLTGGLAAPLVAAGASAIIGGAGAAALGTTAGVAIIGSLFGVAGAGLTGHKMHRRFGAVEEFVFEPMVSGGALQKFSTTKQLHITIAVTGWLSNSMNDVKIPWKNLADSQEQYSLRYESKHLCILGDAINYLLSSAVSMATQEALKYTVLSGIIAAIAWPAALISAANVIDNPWGVCIQRAVAVGKEMAETLLSREQGNRPVTLIGYSLGARVIFYCLEEMSKRKCCEGIIEDVILLGAPVTGDPKTWQRFERVVAGKIINGYSKADWLLKFLYRTSSVQLSVAGLQPIKWNNRRMHNIDLSAIVSGHGDYVKELDNILKVVGVRTKQDVFVPRLTSKDMVAKRNSSLSFTSSEGEDSDDENQSKSHDRSPDRTQTSENYQSDLDFPPKEEQAETASNQSESVNVPKADKENVILEESDHNSNIKTENIGAKQKYPSDDEIRHLSNDESDKLVHSLNDLCCTSHEPESVTKNQKPGPSTTNQAVSVSIDQVNSCHNDIDKMIDTCPITCENNNVSDSSQSRSDVI